MDKVAFEISSEEQARNFLDYVGKQTTYIWNGTMKKPCAEDVENLAFPYYPLWIVFYSNGVITWTEDKSHVDCLAYKPDKQIIDRLLLFPKPNEDDPVNHPSHYTDGKVECIDAMEQVFGTEAVKSFCLCNAFKYHWRHDKKNGDQDLQKAVWYMDYYRKLVNR